MAKVEEENGAIDHHRKSFRWLKNHKGSGGYWIGDNMRFGSNQHHTNRFNSHQVNICDK